MRGGGCSCGSVEHVRAWWGHVTYVFDGGEVEDGQGRTGVDLTAAGEEPPRYAIARGGADVEEVEAVLKAFGLCRANG